MFIIFLNWWCCHGQWGWRFRVQHLFWACPGPSRDPLWPSLLLALPVSMATSPLTVPGMSGVQGPHTGGEARSSLWSRQVLHWPKIEVLPRLWRAKSPIRAEAGDCYPSSPSWRQPICKLWFWPHGWVHADGHCKVWELHTVHSLWGSYPCSVQCAVPWVPGCYRIWDHFRIPVWV